MNNRFKFRIWHEPLKQMHYNDFIVTATGYMAKIYQQDDYIMKFNQEDLEFDKQCILMQCTGLKDKNGKLIYEGDILKIFHVSSTGQGRLDIRYVVYDEDKARFIFCENGYMSYITVDTDDICEVIGNIYENLELLEVSE